jgi:hypothetical protein
VEKGERERTWYGQGDMAFVASRAGRYAQQGGEQYSDMTVVLSEEEEFASEANCQYHCSNEEGEKYFRHYLPSERGNV